MRFAITVLFAASLASAYTILKRQDPPTGCAQNCFQAANPGHCGQSDIACLCATPDFSTSLSACIETSCTSQEVEAATANGKALCKNAGIDLDHLEPDCALACNQTATSSISCAENDIACLCSDTTYVQSFMQCATASCTPEETQTESTYVRALCKAQGIDVSSAVGP